MLQFCSFQYNGSSIKETARGSRRGSGDLPFVGNSTLVSPITGNDCGRFIYSATNKQVALPSSGSRSTTYIEENASRDIPFVREALARSCIHRQTADIILDSWRPSTTKLYMCYIKKWLQSSNTRRIDPFNPPINSVLEVLTELFSSGFGYSTINVAYSALYSVVSLQGNDTIHENKLIKRFLKGVFNKKRLYQSTLIHEMCLQCYNILKNYRHLRAYHYYCCHASFNCCVISLVIRSKRPNTVFN